MNTIEPLADGGWVAYDPGFLGPDEADRLFAFLKESVPWGQQKAPFGHLAPRLTAYFADPGVTYTYSGVVHDSLPWPVPLVDIKRRVEERSDRSFNSLLLNYYRDGKDSMGWHADDETELGENPVVPSISLGATRKFLIRHRRSRESKAYLLTHGSLLLMGGTMQHHWLHAVPKTARPIGERINLTFRHILEAPALASPTKTGPSPA